MLQAIYQRILAALKTDRKRRAARAPGTPGGWRWRVSKAENC